MLLSFERYLKRHLFFQLMGFTFICLLLSFAVVRNAVGNGVLEVLLAAGVVVWGVSFAALRDVPGYWVYAALAPKFLVDAKARENIGQLSNNRFIRSLSPLHHPVVAPSLLAGLMVLLLWAVMSLWPGLGLFFVILVLGLVFPLLLSLQTLATARYALVLAGPEGEALVLESGVSKRRFLDYPREDLLISLSITFALLWPLGGKPAFSLDAGYMNGDFVVASLLLCWIAGFFVVLGARRSRLYSMVGEQLSALFLCEMPRKFEYLSVLSPALRFALYLMLSGCWVGFLCMVFSMPATPPPFAAFCLMLMPVLGGIFWIERGLTLRSDFSQACQFITERSVDPVAVPRRGASKG